VKLDNLLFHTTYNITMIIISEWYRHIGSNFSSENCINDVIEKIKKTNDLMYLTCNLTIDNTKVNYIN